MLVENAQVIALHGEQARVRAQRGSTCGGCAVRSGCGTGALSEWFGRRASELDVRNEVGAKVGDAVQVGIPEKVLIRGSLVVYALPLVLMILFAIAAAWLVAEPSAMQAVNRGASDLPAMLGGAVGLAIGFFIVRMQTRRVMRSQANQPTILRVLIGGDIAVR